MDLDEVNNLAVYYAPFEYVKADVALVLVGITPGPNQMRNAIVTAKSVIAGGGSLEQALIAAKRIGAFSDEPLRTNLIKQLSHWRIHEWLGASSSGEFFEGGGIGERVQTTSLLRYPTFRGSERYRGSPSMTRNALLRMYLYEYFAEEAKLWRHAVILPLGGTVSRVLNYVARAGVIDRGNIIHGLLHPSGENNYRFDYLLADDRSQPPPHRTDPVPYDSGRRESAARFLFGNTHG